MNVKYFSDCLNSVDKLIFEKSLKYMVNCDLEDKRKHIE